MTSPSQFDPTSNVGPSQSFERFSRDEIEQSIASRFEKQVKRYRDLLAIKTADCVLTYGELNRLANRIAHALLGLAEVSNTPVALIPENDAATIARILGLLKAGKIYVPLDPSLPLARNEFILKNSQAEVILASGENLALAGALTTGTVRILDVDNLPSEVSDANPELPVSPAAIAWILYTSGSTGEPKGILQCHRDELHNVMCLTNSQHFCPEDRMTLLRTPSLGGALRNLLSALLNGVSLFAMDLKNHGIEGLAEWLVREEITIYHSSATVFRRFVQSLSGRRVEFPKLRLIRLGSEPVTAADVEAYKRIFAPHCLLVNALSSTEARTFLQYSIDKKTEWPGEMVPVGYPVEDTAILLLDDKGRQVEAGEIGEIVVQSPYLFPGYWRLPELTRERLLPDPAGGAAGMFHTGDLGRLLPDGAYEHHGRKDLQTKIRGFRVQIDEVENTLRAIPQIEQAVVISQEWRNERRLVAFVVPRRNQTITSSGIRNFLRTRLPDYMIPAVNLFLESLPLTASGKVNRAALQLPTDERVGACPPWVAPQTALERVLVQLWAEALGIDMIGVEDNFFELGGNSLSAGEIAAKTGTLFSMQIAPLVLFEANTVTKFLKFLLTAGLDRERADQISQTWLRIGSMSSDEFRAALEKQRCMSQDRG